MTDLSSINLNTMADKLDELAQGQVSLVSGTEALILRCKFHNQLFIFVLFLEEHSCSG